MFFPITGITGNLDKTRKKCEDIMAENIPKAAKERYQPQIQETQLTLGKINTKKPHILGT